MTSLQARHRSDKTMIGLMIAALVVAIVPLVFILADVIIKGIGDLNLSFLTQPEPFVQTAPGGGFGAGMRGTIKMVGLGTAIAVPIGVFAAVYLAEYSGRRNTLARAGRIFAHVMTGIPSIIVRLFVFTVLVMPSSFFSTIAGGRALGIMVVPGI